MTDRKTRTTTEIFKRYQISVFNYYLLTCAIKNKKSFNL